MKALTIIAATLLATAASGQSFLDQLCDGTNMPEGARPDDDICGLRDQGKWQPIRNQLSKMIVANRNAGNPNVYYTDAKFFGEPPVAIRLKRPWMEDDWRILQMDWHGEDGHRFHQHAPSQQIFFTSADRSFFVSVNEEWFDVDYLPRHPSLYLEYTHNVSIHRRSTHRVYRVLEHDGDLSHEPSNLKAYVESYLDCLETERMRDLHASFTYTDDAGVYSDVIYSNVHAHLDADNRVTHLQPGMATRDKQDRAEFAEEEEKVSCQ